MRELTLAQFQQKLNQGITDTTVKKALNRACVVVENDAKRRCPVGKTGLLRNSIKHRVQNNEGTVGTIVDYAP